MNTSANILTKISSILELILDLGQIEPNKKAELLDQLKTSLVTNIACSIVEEIPEDKQDKYNDIITRVADSKSTDQQAKSKLLVDALQSIVGQCSPAKLDEIVVEETTHMIEQLLSPLKDELDQETLDSLKAQTEAILAD